MNFKKYYILSPIDSFQKLEDVSPENEKDLTNLCEALYKRLNNGLRDVYDSFLDFSDKEVIKGIKDDSVIYIVAHGNSNEIGTSDETISVSPEKLAEVLEEANLNKSNKISIKLATCESGLNTMAAQRIYGEKTYSNFFSPQAKPKKYSFAQELAIEMQKRGYEKLTIYGYLGEILEATIKNKTGTIEEYHCFAKKNDRESTKFRAKDARVRYEITVDKKIESGSENKSNLDLFSM